MTFEVFVRGAAESDLLEAQLWYADVKPSLAVEFHDEVVAVLDLLSNTPLIYPKVYGEVRRAILRKFPYLVWFMVEEDSVHVLACTHSHADPSRAAARVGRA